jgi:translation initiation factor IF-1
VPRGEIIQLDARVVGMLSDTAFRAELGNGHRIVAYAAEAARSRVRGLRPGDPVKVELSPFDMSAGRIVDAVERRGGT